MGDSETLPGSRTLPASRTLPGRGAGPLAAMVALAVLTGGLTAVPAGPAAADSFGTTTTVGAASTSGPRARLPFATPDALAAAATRRVSPAATAIGYALSMLGRPYRYGGSSPETGFDCSGLALLSYASAGVRLPRTAAQQFAALAPLPIAQARPGDLMFWADDVARPESIYHVSLFVGGAMVISAPTTGSTVRLKPVGRRNLVPFVVRPGGEGAPVLPLTERSPAWAIAILQQRLRNNGRLVQVTGVLDAATRAALGRLPLALSVTGGEVDPRAWDWLVAHGELAHVA